MKLQPPVFLTALAIVAAAFPGFSAEPAPVPPPGAKQGPPQPGGSVIEANLTTYYIAEVAAATTGSGIPVTARSLNGEQQRVLIPAETLRRAEMQSLAIGQAGRMWIQVGKRTWEELPAGWMGMGNRRNPIVPYHHVAADQTKYPYGSLIYFPEADGYTNVNGDVMDGCFWVGDVGGLIKGRSRFDVFVGRQQVFEKVMDRGNGKLSTKGVVYRLPKAPKGFEPGKPEGLAAILRNCGCLPKSAEVPTPETLNAALIEFQKSKPKIPEVEYGIARAATTLWYLTEAALTAAK